MSFHLPTTSQARNSEKVFRTDLSTLQYQLQPIETSSFLGVRAAQRGPGGQYARKGERDEVELLDSMGRGVPAAENNAANAALLHHPQQQAAKSVAEFLVMGHTGGGA